MFLKHSVEVVDLGLQRRSWETKEQDAGVGQFLVEDQGFDHGVGHSLLLLYDAKAPRGQKSKEFKGLGYYPSNTLIGLFYIIPKYTICVTI